MTRSSTRLLFAATIAMLLALSMSSLRASAPTTAALVSISDGTNGGNAHFFFLGPISNTVQTNGVFAPALRPAVEICEWNGTICAGPPVARFTTAGDGSRTIRVTPDDEAYVVNWKTDSSALRAGSTYRISVLAPAGVELGHADVVLQAPSSPARARDYDARGRLLVRLGSTLPVRFRLEEGAFSLARTVAAEPDSSAAVTSRISKDGGSIVAWRNGVRFTLTVPPKAVLDPTDITLTPLAGVNGLAPTAPAIAAVDLEPEGLLLYRPATLLIELTAPLDPADTVGFGYSSNGASFHLMPSSITPLTLAFTITHFSGVGAKSTSFGDCTQGPGRTDQAAAQEQIACVLAMERNDPDNLTGDDADALVNILEAWYRDTIRSEISGAADVDAEKLAFNDFETWLKTIDLLGLDNDTLSEMEGDAHELFDTYMEQLNTNVDGSCIAAQDSAAKDALLKELLLIQNMAEYLNLNDLIKGTQDLCGGALDDSKTPYVGTFTLSYSYWVTYQTIPLWDPSHTNSWGCLRSVVFTADNARFDRSWAELSATGQVQITRTDVKGGCYGQPGYETTASSILPALRLGSTPVMYVEGVGPSFNVTLGGTVTDTQASLTLDATAPERVRDSYYETELGTMLYRITQQAVSTSATFVLTRAPSRQR